MAKIVCQICGSSDVVVERNEVKRARLYSGKKRLKPSLKQYRVISYICNNCGVNNLVVSDKLFTDPKKCPECGRLLLITKYNAYCPICKKIYEW